MSSGALAAASGIIRRADRSRTEVFIGGVGRR
jgi:hypothetical protein